MELLKDKFTPYQKFLVAMLGILQFTIILDFMILSPLGDILMKSLDITPVKFGWVVSGYAFSAAISGILAGGFADKFDRKKMLIFFYIGFILGTLCCALASSFVMLLGARIVTGLFGGVVGSVSLAIVADEFEINHRGRVMGVIQMSFAASQILGIPIGLYLANLWGWHSTFLMIIGVGLAVLAVVIVKMKPIVKHLAIQSDKKALLHLWHTLSNKTYITGFLATASLSLGGFMLMPFGSAFLINNVHITQGDLPLVFMLTGVSTMIVMPIIGKLSDKFDKFKLYVGGSLVAMVMVIVYTTLGQVPLWEVIAVNMVLMMGIMSRMVPATTLTTAIPEMKDRGAFMSVSSSLQQMAGGIAAVVAGSIVMQQSKTSPLEHYDTLGIIVAGLIAFSIYLIYNVNRIVDRKISQHKPV